MRICYRCGKEIPVEGKVGRREACPFCRSDLHACLNCRFFDPAAYNQCREPQAERVLGKDRSNFCDFFVFRDSDSDPGPEKEKKGTKDKLDALFNSR